MPALLADRRPRVLSGNCYRQRDLAMDCMLYIIFVESMGKVSELASRTALEIAPRVEPSMQPGSLTQTSQLQQAQSPPHGRER